MERRKPGVVRDAIFQYLKGNKEATVSEIHAAIEPAVGGKLARSSVRSYLGLNTPETFKRTGRGTYRLVK